jgi:hypothetical protein
MCGKGPSLNDRPCRPASDPIPLASGLCSGKPDAIWGTEDTKLPDGPPDPSLRPSAHTTRPPSDPPGAQRGASSKKCFSQNASRSVRNVFIVLSIRWSISRSWFNLFFARRALSRVALSSSGSRPLLGVPPSLSQASNRMSWRETSVPSAHAHCPAAWGCSTKRVTEESHGGQTRRRNLSRSVLFLSFVFSCLYTTTSVSIREGHIHPGNVPGSRSRSRAAQLGSSQIVAGHQTHASRRCAEIPLYIRR